ncbi:CrcB family protein [uncultured Cellulomonas sp.]|uniref:fluoride efflux transporter FluC n=1 Tax=uncultured Cellulomonas sp. TaxID=189682 RepID=UPI0028E7E6C1|nr:CrcB family protein [uncultured Cellulomonas sp.]
MTRPAHLDPRLVGVVALGGAVGTAARWGMTHWLGSAPGGWPTATFVENLLGSFLLGLLLEALLRRGSESRRGQLVRLGAGTGVLGGFTTFSALALEIERLLAADQVLLGALYGVLSVVLGLLACLAGVALASQHHRRREAR